MSVIYWKEYLLQIEKPSCSQTLTFQTVGGTVAGVITAFKTFFGRAIGWLLDV